MNNRATQAKAAIPYSEYPYTGQPSDTQTVTIGSDVYEFCTDAGSVAADTRIGVVIGASADATYANLVAAINAKNKTNEHPTLFRTDDTTPARANGTEKVRAVQDATGDVVYLFRAIAVGSTDLVEGDAPSLVLSDTASNGGPWKHLNVNLTIGGAADLQYKSAALVHTVVTANLTGTSKIPLPFAPVSWQVSCYSTAGLLLPEPDVIVTVPAAVSGQNFLGVKLDAATADYTPLVAGDVIHILVSG